MLAYESIKLRAFVLCSPHPVYPEKVIVSCSQGFESTVYTYNSLFQFQLSVSLDIFDGLLFEFDAVLGAGLGILSTDDVIRSAHGPTT